MTEDEEQTSNPLIADTEFSTYMRRVSCPLLRQPSSLVMHGLACGDTEQASDTSLGLLTHALRWRRSVFRKVPSIKQRDVSERQPIRNETPLMSASPTEAYTLCVTHRASCDDDARCWYDLPMYPSMDILAEYFSKKPSRSDMTSLSELSQKSVKPQSNQSINSGRCTRNQV